MHALPALRSLGVALATAAALGLAAAVAWAQSGLPPARRAGLVGASGGATLDEAAWARHLVDALGIADALPADATPGDRFSLLCPRSAGTRVATLVEPLPLARADGPGAEEAWRGGPIRPGRYRVAVHGAGAAVWSTAGATIGVLAPGALSVDVTGRPVELRGRRAELRARLADGGRVQRVEIAPWTASCIAPAAGWSAGRALTFGAKARTMVLALDALERLPGTGRTIRVEAEHFDASRGDGALTDRALAVPASADRWVEAVGDVAEFRYAFELAEPGLYSVLARVHGAGRQIWSLDRTLLAPVAAGEEAPRFAWSEVTTVWLEAGSHTLRARLPRGAGIDVLRIVQRRTDDEAFLEALRSLGLREGAATQTVDARAARRNREALEDLLRAGPAASSGLASVEAQLEDLYRRPLSPILPGDL